MSAPGAGGDGPLVLVTRPSEDAGPLAARLTERGCRVLVEPMLTVRWLDGPEPDLGDVRALLFTSANGVRGYVRRSPRRDLPVYAVGHATAAAAREAGFAAVESADGDVYALADLVRRRSAPSAGVLLHVAGSSVAGDLSERLAASGFTVRRETLYDTVPARSLSDDAARALRDGGLHASLFFSPRTARSFVRLVDEAGLAHHCRTVDALCLSPAVADAVRTLDGSRVVAWRNVRVAPHPRQDDLLSLLAASPDPG